MRGVPPWLRALERATGASASRMRGVPPWLRALDRLNCAALDVTPLAPLRTASIRHSVVKCGIRALVHDSSFAAPG